MAGKLYPLCMAWKTFSLFAALVLLSSLSGCREEVIELAAPVPAEVEELETMDAVDQGMPDSGAEESSQPERAESIVDAERDWNADVHEPEPPEIDSDGDAETARDVDASESEQVEAEQGDGAGVCAKTCYLLDDCGFLDIPGSPFGNTLDACLQGAGTPSCDRLWDLDPQRAECVTKATDCDGLWTCLING